ncbi:MAG: hypothetical protein BWY31_04121 [Lentisphaerae bacterium ADurb.Bin242]|nr:MAG: hypothetical protein BWY31_04121 [Lentisphaerae bacterium ADurb.Bin242]
MKIINGLIMSVLLQSLMSVSYAENLEPSGKYENMLENSNLELYAGDFPGKWRLTGAKPIYIPNGAPQGGGIFRFSEKNKKYLIRQDWTFSLVEGEKYRLSAWIKTDAFDAEKAQILVFNNGWSWAEEMNIPPGNGNWRKIETVFAAGNSRGGVFSCGILVDRIRKGFLEVSGLRIEPATEESFKVSYAYLNEIPPQTLVPLFPRLKRIFGSSPALNFKWFGEPDSLIGFSVDGIKLSDEKPDGQGIVILRLSTLKPGKYRLSAKSGSYRGEWEIEIHPEFPEPAPVKKNNLHWVLAEVTVKKNGTGKFINPRDGWVLFRLPAKMSLNIQGSKGPVTDGGFVELPAGEHDFTVTGTSGKVTVSAIAETLFYQLCGGPYMPKLEKNSWDLYLRNLIPYATTFYDGSAGSAENWKIFRTKNNRMMGRCDLAVMLAVKKGDSLAQFPGLNPKNGMYDGITLDEFAGDNIRMHAQFIKSSVNYSIPTGRVIYPWVCGTPGKSPFTASFISHTANLGGTSKLLYEAYIPSNFMDEAQAQKLIENRTNEVMELFEKNYPGARNFVGLILCSSNVPLSFTMDNHPAVNYKYFQDMQFHQLAVGKGLDGLPCVGYWGGNYSDTEMSRWIGALFRHYVIEGKRELLSKNYGYTFRPDHLLNCDFEKGLESWKTSGKVSVGTADGFARVLKRFHCLPDTGTRYAVFSGGTLSQKICRLEAGKLYKVRFVTSDAKDTVNGNPASLKLNCTLMGAAVLPESVIHVNKTPAWVRPANYDEFIFRAEGENALLSFNDSGNPEDAKIALHYISVMPYFEK